MKRTYLISNHCPRYGLLLIKHDMNGATELPLKPMKYHTIPFCPDLGTYFSCRIVQIVRSIDSHCFNEYVVKCSRCIAVFAWP